jgi:threonine synthase
MVFLCELVHNIALEGSFDDCQDIVKSLFGDAAFKEEYQLGAINSINWARILAQTTYYFYSFFSVMKQNGIPLDASSYQSLQQIQYSVPSGNFGDVLAGFFAKQMGLPVHRFIVATNENDILDRFLKTGRYDKQESSNNQDPVKQTYSPAMDILISSNFERLLWYLVQSPDGRSIYNQSDKPDAIRASATIKQFMDDLKSKGGFSVPASVLELARSMFDSHRVTDQETKDCITRYYHNQFTPQQESLVYVLDPHTAVGVVAAEELLQKGEKNNGIVHTVCLSTASPGKFPDVVLSAINDNAPLEAIHQGFRKLEYADIAPQALVHLDGKPQRMTHIKTRGEKKRGLDSVRTAIVETLRPLGSRL